MTFSSPKPPMRAASTALFAAALLFVPLSSALAGDVFYSGRATAVSGKIKLLEIEQNVLVSDNGMSCQGLPKNETLYNVSQQGAVSVRADEAYTFTQGKDRSAITKARLSGLQLDIPGLAVALTAVESRAEASCDENNAYTVKGKSTLGTLTVNGQPYTLSGQPNQSFEIPGIATLTVNEQVRFSREVRVVGLRIKLLDPKQPLSGDIQVAAARAKISCE
jgi:hypothetical protein